MIGRAKEREYLLSLLKEEEPQFVAVFGRRRVGKTYLIRETFGHDFTFEHTGVSNESLEVNSRKAVQLEKFTESLKNYGYEPLEKITTWNDAFNGLKEVIKTSKATKKVIFIDELSWMDTKDSGLISALESFWNGWATARKEKDIILIVCASATYWMIDNIVNARGGLHNRLTGQIQLKPFTLNECREYLKHRNIIFNQHQTLMCYMILGGVPFYWSLLRKGKSLPQNIDELFFKENALLRNEYENLYKALFNKPEQYMKIIEALCNSKKGLTREEISTKARISSSGDFSRKLTELENCGFIRKFIPFGYKQNNYVYQLIDNYTLFYHKFLKNNNHYEENFWQNQINNPDITAWSGLAFERVCLEHIPQIKMALGISGVYTEVNAWQTKEDKELGTKGAQIDLLIVRKDQIINICEMKYSETGFIVSKSFINNLRQKIQIFIAKTKTKYAIHPTLVTSYPVIENEYSKELQSIITADALFL